MRKDCRSKGYGTREIVHIEIELSQKLLEKIQRAQDHYGCDTIEDVVCRFIGEYFDYIDMKRISEQTSLEDRVNRLAS